MKGPSASRWLLHRPRLTRPATIPQAKGIPEEKKSEINQDNPSLLGPGPWLSEFRQTEGNYVQSPVGIVGTIYWHADETRRIMAAIHAVPTPRKINPPPTQDQLWATTAVRAPEQTLRLAVLESAIEDGDSEWLESYTFELWCESVGLEPDVARGG